ncbi:hypothetical protein ACNHYB_14615 [Isoptericola jiangsuensis]|uniref:hypothetical protein n=1 Tax=Isoptericola jiangsuensis TaxID=548579 RepID=UPI003AAC9F03
MTGPQPVAPQTEGSVDIRESGEPRARWLRGPAWPLVVLLAGFPVFWALGLSEFAVPVMAVPMAVILYRRRPLKFPRGFLIWGVFLIWTLAGVLLLGIDPAGYVDGSASGRLIAFGVRELSYFSVTIVMLFVGNLTEEELPTRRLVRLLGVFFAWVVAGGLLGLLAPHFHFTSPFEMVLPHSIRSDDYVQNLVHPRASQVQSVFAAETPRPSAPFAYTNEWGFTITLLGVWAVVAWYFLPGAKARIRPTLLVLTGIVILIYSLNRAAWIGVAVAVVYVAIVLALRGRLVLVVSMLLIGSLGMGALLATPLGAVVEQRLENGKSDDIRTFTTEKAFELVTVSPMVGLGSTRSTLGSASSIAVGESPKCPTCGNASIGMNGYLYMLMVTTGYGGVALFFTFGAVQVWQCRRLRSPVVLGGTAVILMTAFYSLFYDAATWMLVPFVTLGLLWRESRRAQATGEQRPLLDTQGSSSAT